MPLKITQVHEPLNLGLVKKGLLRVNKTDKNGNEKMMNITDIKEINKIMSKRTQDKGKYYLKVNGIGNVFFTPKTLDGEMNLDEFEDYFLGKVKDSAKFTNEFFSINVGYLVNNK